ncbi:MAG: protein kinase [Kiritimatiellae bacterium]|nr:protein kinase [Kiritimatiellia bacterium]
MSTGFEDSDELLEGYLARTGGVAAGEASDRDRLWREGREVGEWTVAGFVGHGGSAEVYCARHRRLGTSAVLKVLWRDGDGPRERFLRETRFLMESGGGSFPAFYGAGEEDGRPWMAMELLEEYPLPSSDAGAAAYLLDVARGVEALHRHGWIHRDLKPRNILRRAADGRAVLADFGLLKKIAENPVAETASERISPSVVDGREVGVGTPGYAAPEQFAGGAATPATDVHALGMLADECFGGKPPRAWDRIIRRATGSLPRQRYADAVAFARAIRRRHWRRNAACLALLCAVALALGAWWWALPPYPSPVAPPVSPVPETPPTPSSPEQPEPVAPPVDSQEPPAPVRSAREARALALARFEADEERKEAISALLADMRANKLEWRRKLAVPSWSGCREVTQRQWTALMDDNPSRFQGDDLPVDSLTMGACLEFLERLNATSVAREAGRRYRLPAAWEWQQVADSLAAGTSAERLAAGWFAENAEGRTHPVGEKAEDGHWADLFGNVRELTYSWGTADGKEGFLCQGGSWADAAATPTAAVLEQPPSIRRFLDPLDQADPRVGTFPSGHLQEVCPAPGEIGFRLWAEPRTLPPNPVEEALATATAHWEDGGGEP